MTLKEAYDSICQTVKIFEKKGYFNIFSSADLFLIEDENDKTIFSFMEEFGMGSYGCQLFYNNDGFNFIHDVFTVNDEEKPLFYDCDSICCIIVDKDKLTDKNKAYLKKFNKKPAKSNVFVYRLEKGYGEKEATQKELILFNDFCVYLNSILKNEMQQIADAFKKNLVPYAKIDNKRLEYQFNIIGLPYLETFPKKSKCNLDFVNEFKDSIYHEDEYDIVTSYLPAQITEKRIRALLVVLYNKSNNTYIIKYLLDNVRENKKYVFSILYDVFKNDGVPTKILTNNRILYSHLEKTFDSLHIEYKFQREISNPDYVIKVMSSLIFKMTNDKPITSLEFGVYFEMCLIELETKYLSDDAKILKENVFQKNIVS